MNHLSYADQRFVPISAVDNIISDIHTINHNIRQINPTDPLHVIVPTVLAETRRSAELRSQSLPRSSSRPGDVLVNNQRDIAMRLSALHSKVNQYIVKTPERSASPVRNTRITESVLRTPPRNTESVRFFARPAEVITKSSVLPEYRTAQSIEISSPLKGELRKSVTWGNVTDLAVDAVLNQVKRESSPLRSSPMKSSLANGGSSPTRPLGILRQKSLTDSSPVGRGSVGAAGYSTRSPVKATGGSNFGSFVLTSSMSGTESLYDKLKLDNIIAGIKAREAVLQGTKGYGSVSEPRKPILAQGLNPNETPRF